MNILYLSPYLPAIDTCACARKVYDSVRLLHQRGHKIYLLSFCTEQDKKRINSVKPYCTQFHLEYIKDYFHYPNSTKILTQKIESLSKDGSIDILQCEDAFMGRFLPKSNNIPKVLTEHEVLSVSFYQRSKCEKNLINKVILYIRILKKLFEEKKWYKKFNKVIVFTENDEDIIRKRYNIEHIDAVPLGINLEDYPLGEASKKPYDIIFVGNFAHQPNVDAVLYFCKKILPLLKKEMPNISILIVGADPPLCIKKLANLEKNIVVTGYVKDVTENYCMSRIAIAPIRYGTGMCFKILEALASGIPVVSTSIGARGTILKDNIKIANSERDFADVIIELLNNQNTCMRLAEKGRLTIKKCYDWNVLLNKYENIYSDLVKKIKSEQDRR